MLLRLLKQLIFGAFRFGHRVYVFAQNQLSGIRKNSSLSKETQGKLAHRSSWQRAAIVILHPDPSLTPFTVNLLNGLVENHFFVLAVTAKKLPENFADNILSHSHHLLETVSIDPDVGAVKIGLNWIEHHTDLKNIHTLALIDDRFYYPRHISSTIGQILKQDGDWLSLFDVSEMSDQRQNFFHIFRKAVFKSDAFEELMQAQPTVKSETGLANTLFKTGLTARAYYHVKRLCADILTALENDHVPAPLHDTLNLALGFEKRQRNSRLPPRAQDSLALPAAEIARRISKLAQGNKPKHALGLLYNYFYQAPIKQNLGNHEMRDASDFVVLTQGFSISEKKILLEEMRRQASHITIASIRKIPEYFLRKARRA